MIYLDHSATTPVHPKVLESMLPYFSEKFGNPSSVYGIAQEARQAVEDSRSTVAEIMGATPREIIFTGCGSESDNAAIKGVAFALRDKGNHIITSKIEHHAVLETCKYMTKFGFEVTELPVDKYGVVNPEDLRKSIKDTTVLVSIMMVNNEVGTIEPIAEIGKLLKEVSKGREKKVFFHTDAVQAAGYLDINVDSLGVDLMSLASHKFYGPKGCGVLYLRRNVPFLSQMQGGTQERNRRAGTENVPSIVGTAVALKLAAENRESNRKHCQGLRERLVKGIQDKVKGAILTGHPVDRLPGLASFCFEFVEGESILLQLDFHGIAASSGSACTSASLEPSHVLLAMGMPHEIAHGSIRFSMGPENTEEEIDSVVSLIPGIVDKLRAMSPLTKGKYS